MGGLRLNNHMIIRELKQLDIHLLKGITPVSWNSPVENIVERFFGAHFFHPVTAVVNDGIAGIGHLIVNGKTGWLGNIIVLEKHRNQGIGKRISEQLINLGKNCNSLLLIATKEGYPLYSRLGFQTSHNYLFFKDGKVPCPDSEQIVNATKSDSPQILDLDQEVSGENRQALLHPFLPSAMIYKSVEKQEVTGFYLQSFGAGLIVAKERESGLNLLKYKLFHHPEKQICIPESNISARSFLEQHAYKQHLKVPRMYLRSEVSWKPEMIFSRATGYTG